MDHAPLSLSHVYRKELLENVVPFWEKHSLDSVNGGYLTCLDREGRAYDTDKFMWLQWRQIWMFSRLYNTLERRESWREIAKHGLQFAAQFGRDQGGQHYFSLSKEGLPLTHAYNIYTECFAALAWKEFFTITKTEEHRDCAVQAFDNFMHRRSAPKGRFNKQTSTRSMQGFGISMMSAYLAFEMEEIIGCERANKCYLDCFETILNRFYDAEYGVIRENILLDGSFHDSMDGRLLNPGHSLEAIWFLLDIADHCDRGNLMDKLCGILVQILKFSWDQVHGGIYYFMDIAGHPPQQLEHDQKLWWVHLEALVALSRAVKLRPNQEVEDWLLRVHNYTFAHFPDPQHGEWYGYLSRSGLPHSTLKGGKWKGCYHLPRALLECLKSLENIEQQRSLQST